MIASEERIAKVRTTYGGTIQEVLAKEPAHDPFEILGAIEVLVGSKVYRRISTSPAERMVFAFNWLAREVQNGGFHQYFVNSAGDFWKDVLSGLASIGDNDGLALFRQALSIFPDSSPSEKRDSRLKQIDELNEDGEDKVWNHFKIVTDRYFRTPFPKWKSVFDYVKAHPDEFDLRGA